MRPGWSPIRRNKNIGTKKSRKIKSNYFWIPDNLEMLIIKNGYSQTIREINGVEIIFITEKLKDEYLHCCTTKEIAKVLSFIPKDDLDGLRFIVQKQPTKKEEILSPCWGKFVYDFNFKKEFGAAIFIYAINPERKIVWDYTLKPDNIRELRSLEKEGHFITRIKDKIIIKSKASSVRKTQLYRTLFHEIGHLVNWMNFYRSYNYNNIHFSDLLKIFLEKPYTHREDYANFYSRQIIEKLIEKKLIPIQVE